MIENFRFTVTYFMPMYQARIVRYLVISGIHAAPIRTLRSEVAKTSDTSGSPYQFLAPLASSDEGRNAFVAFLSHFSILLFTLNVTKLSWYIIQVPGTQHLSTGLYPASSKPYRPDRLKRDLRPWFRIRPTLTEVFCEILREMQLQSMKYDVCCGDLCVKCFETESCINKEFCGFMIRVQNRYKY